MLGIIVMLGIAMACAVWMWEVVPECHQYEPIKTPQTTANISSIVVISRSAARAVAYEGAQITEQCLAY